MKLPASDVNIPKSQIKYDVLLDFEFFVRPREVVGKHLEIFHQGEGESTVGSVRHFDVSLLRKFTNHDDFAVTVRYRSFFKKSHTQSSSL